MTTWPTSLPRPTVDSFSETTPNNSIRSSMDKGPAKVRRRTTANVRPISFSLKLEPSLVDVVDEFYIDTTASGSLSFDFVHPRTLETVEARFVEPPSYKELGNALFNVSISLEVLP